MDADLLNAEAVPGHNVPPVPTPFELSECEIGDLFTEAANWLDGVQIENEDQAEAVGNILRDMRAARTRADERRAADKAPWDAGAQAVQDAYAPLIADTKKIKGKATRAIEGCKALLDKWLAKVEAEKRAKADAARREAEERERIAFEAMQASSVDNLAERERAEVLVDQAKAATKEADRADKDRAVVRGGGRAISSRLYHDAVLVDPVAALRHAREVWPDDLKAWLAQRAQQDMNRGVLTIPGFDAVERRTVA